MREFDAPRHLVFRAFTEPALIKRWWSGRRATLRLTIEFASTTARDLMAEQMEDGMQESYDVLDELLAEVD